MKPENENITILKRNNCKMKNLRNLTTLPPWFLFFEQLKVWWFRNVGNVGDWIQTQHNGNAVHNLELLVSPFLKDFYRYILSVRAKFVNALSCSPTKF